LTLLAGLPLPARTSGHTRTRIGAARDSPDNRRIRQGTTVEPAQISS